jgi:hypothetical protein
MRKITFEVSTKIITEFSTKLIDLNLINEIIGVTGDDEIEIEIQYEKSESDQVDELEEYFEELNS